MAALQPRARWAGLDTLRGITIISMIAYHACWDLVYIFGLDWPWYHTRAAYIWQQSICWTFILLSGFCFHLGRHRLRRGLMAFGGGVLVSAVTLVVMPKSPVICGVLTLLGTATLVTIPLDGMLRRIPARAGLAGSFGLFLLLRDVNEGWLGFEGVHFLKLPGSLYRGYLTAFLGLPQAGFRSTDYFSLLPWLFLFWTGYYLYRLRRDEPAELRLPVVSALGRHSLVAYLLHQPLVYAVLMCWSYLL